jgi:hypothetical protein
MKKQETYIVFKNDCGYWRFVGNEFAQLFRYIKYHGKQHDDSKHEKKGA